MPSMVSRSDNSSGDQLKSTYCLSQLRVTFMSAVLRKELQADGSGALAHIYVSHDKLCSAVQAGICDVNSIKRPHDEWRSARSSSRICSTVSPCFPVAYFSRSSCNSFSHCSLSAGETLGTGADSARVSLAFGLPSTVITTSSPLLANSTSRGRSCWPSFNVATMDAI